MTRHQMVSGDVERNPGLKDEHTVTYLHTFLDAALYNVIKYIPSIKIPLTRFGILKATRCLQNRPSGSPATQSLALVAKVLGTGTRSPSDSQKSCY